MENFLIFIFWTVVAIWLSGWLLRLALGRWLRRSADAFDRAQKTAHRTDRQRPSATPKEGEVTIDGAGPRAAKKVNSGVGDYVDFEEVSEADPEPQTSSEPQANPDPQANEK